MSASESRRSVEKVRVIGGRTDLVGRTGEVRDVEVDSWGRLLHVRLDGDSADRYFDAKDVEVYKVAVP